MGEFRILVSSAGRRVALVRLLREALREAALPGAVLAADMSPLSSATHLADRCFLVPPCDDPEFVPTMLRLCAQEGVRLLIPTIDPELSAYAAHRERFAAVGTTVAVSAPEAIALTLDKQATHEWLERNGIPTVHQASASDVLDGSGPWSFPVIVKPRRGSAAVGVTVCETPAALGIAAQQGEVVVQSIARGQEYTVDVFVDRAGRSVSAVPRRRIEVRGGEVSKGVTVRHPALEALARRVGEVLPGAYGVLNVQMFLDDGGDVRVIEVNPRFGGGFPLAWEAGARYPQWLIEDAAGLPTDLTDDWREGLAMLRYDDAVFVDAGTIGLRP